MTVEILTRMVHEVMNSAYRCGNRERELYGLKYGEIVLPCGGDLTEEGNISCIVREGGRLVTKILDPDSEEYDAIMMERKREFEGMFSRLGYGTGIIEELNPYTKKPTGRKLFILSPVEISP